MHKPWLLLGHQAETQVLEGISLGLSLPFCLQQFQMKKQAWEYKGFILASSRTEPGSAFHYCLIRFSGFSKLCGFRTWLLTLHQHVCSLAGFVGTAGGFQKALLSSQSPLMRTVPEMWAVCE